MVQMVHTKLLRPYHTDNGPDFEKEHSSEVESRGGAVISSSKDGISFISIVKSSRL